jgi:hypothetical protein
VPLLDAYLGMERYILSAASRLKTIDHCVTSPHPLKGKSMENTQLTSTNSHFECNEQNKQIGHPREDNHHAPSSSGDQVMLDYLMNVGFAWEEAVMLLHLREHLYENAEMRQRMTDDLRMHFARWLYVNGEMDDY